MVNQAQPTKRETGGDQQDLSQRRARRLARRAQQRWPDGSRRRLARRAWRILLAAGDGGDRNAIGVVWREWLRAGDDELWQVLSGWPDVREIAVDVCAAAVNPRVPAGRRVLIGMLCARHALVPDGDVPLVLFYLLTGQADQHRAADPDGSLLVAAYRAATEPTRAALRGAIARAGHLDLVRLLASADGPDRAALLTVDECRYLASQLASRRDWDRLWGLVKDFPLAEAVAALRLLPDRWRPDGDRDRFLFDRLTGISPSALAAATAQLSAAALRRVSSGLPAARADLTKAALKRARLGHDLRGATCSFSPDARRLAVAVNSKIMVLEMPGLTFAEMYRADSPENRLSPPIGLLHVGDAVLACGTCVPHSGRPAATALVRYTGNGARVLLYAEGPIRLAYHPKGFILQHIVGDTDRRRRDGGRRIQLRAADGRLLQDIPIPAEPGPPNAANWPWITVADPGTGLIALGGDRLWVYDPEAMRILAGADVLGQVTGGVWIGRDRIAVTAEPDRAQPGQASLQTFRLAAPQLEHQSSRGTRPSYQYGSHLVFDPAGNEIAVLGQRNDWADYYDAKDLAIRRAPETVGSIACSSADGRYLAILICHQSFGGRYDDYGEPIVDEDWALHVADRWLRAVDWLARQPMAALRPSDLAVAQAARDAFPGSPASPLLDLFTACVTHRFGADVGIGPGAPDIGDDEIGISGPIGGRGC